MTKRCTPLERSRDNLEAVMSVHAQAAIERPSAKMSELSASVEAQEDLVSELRRHIKMYQLTDCGRRIQVMENWRGLASQVIANTPSTHAAYTRMRAQMLWHYCQAIDCP
eukprot:3887317-Amphidinium_carterae.1